MKFSKQLQEKITELKALEEKATSSSEKIRGHNAKVADELAEAEAELKVAIAELADNPSDSNRTKEREARRRVAELQLELNGAKERENVVFGLNSGKTSSLKLEILEMARDEIRANRDANEEKVLKRIAKAKQEYLEAAKSYYDLLITDGQKKYYDLVQEIDVPDRIAQQNEPGLSVHHPIYTYRDNGPNKYGIFEDEVKRAWERGRIE
ncbi:hypothetical protein OZL92_24015 [Bacillus sonorensis]|uniref:Uncharacterized protein n=1 Tax=Bacillus sonorensis L12 TaxID=1274524 RepID=M5NXZ5_9BACI|nr:hypothetical protein [Bacillus sonorensis]EME72109.1 hypothetical protein BSONL12_23812 [Bacillus sonorensis L12]MCZ0075739.1 hypothetical protein [Bacillus sonorensis]MCZ0094361.1 hypothetical protein [Bacillus sonorensis]